MRASMHVAPIYSMKFPSFTKTHLPYHFPLRHHYSLFSKFQFLCHSPKLFYSLPTKTFCFMTMPTNTIKNHHSNRVRAVWLSCLASSYRSALACTIVGLITLYGPPSVRGQVGFPAFSYVTVIIIVTDATLGDTLHGCWLALYATIQSIGPAILSLWLIGPARFKSTTTALAVAIAAYVVALPNETTHLKAKRIALGQIVITYVIGFVNGEHTEVVMHPVHVAASTGVGVLACVLALLLPYPRLACCEVKRNCKQLAENSSERLKLYVKALCAEDNASALTSVSQAKLLTIGGTKLIQSIKVYRESMKWERIPFKFLRPYYMNPGEMLQDLQLPLKGMEMAVTSIHSFPVQMLDGEFKQILLTLEERISLTIKEAKSSLPCDFPTIPESNGENIMKLLQKVESIPKTNQDLPSFFFLFCMKLLQSKSLPKPTCSGQNDLVKKIEPSTSFSKQNGFSFKEAWSSWFMKLKSKRLMPAFKCSLSLGLAVLFGMLYSKPNGIWSGLPVAISLATAREPTFKVANVKAQGTVIGTVYGVLGCFLFQRFLIVRFLSLIPWFIFTSFLRRSRMYGQAGGISAVIGAVLILGRKDFGPPKDFAIERIVETFIGLSSSIMVDLLFLPTRASTLAKVQLSKSLETLHDCIGSMTLQFSRANFLENQKKLKICVSKLGKCIGEAEVEPNFWFLPFNSACYSKLLGSLAKMMDLLLFSSHSVAFLEQESQKFEASWREEVRKLESDLELLKEKVGLSIKSFQEFTMIKSLSRLEKELKNKNISYDLEMGKSPNENTSTSDIDEDAMGKIISSYLQHSKELIDKIHAAEGDQKELKIQVLLSLNSFGYCMQSLIRETRQLEEGLKELIQWENPSSDVNLLEITSKIHALYNKI